MVPTTHFYSQGDYSPEPDPRSPGPGPATFLLLSGSSLPFIYPHQAGGGRQAHLPDAREHVRLSIVVPVGTNSQVHLFAVGVSFEGFCDPQDGIWGAHLHMGPPGAETGNTRHQLQKQDFHGQKHLRSATNPFQHTVACLPCTWQSNRRHDSQCLRLQSTFPEGWRRTAVSIQIL